jgi:hypothetical protein
MSGAGLGGFCRCRGERPSKETVERFQQKCLVKMSISEGWSTGEPKRCTDQRHCRVPQIKGLMTSDKQKSFKSGEKSTSRSSSRYFFNKIRAVFAILTREVPRTRVILLKGLWPHQLLPQMRPRNHQTVLILPANCRVFQT